MVQGHSGCPALWAGILASEPLPLTLRFRATKPTSELRTYSAIVFRLLSHALNQMAGAQVLTR